MLIRLTPVDEPRYSVVMDILEQFRGQSHDDLQLRLDKIKDELTVTLIITTIGNEGEDAHARAAMMMAISFLTDSKQVAFRYPIIECLLRVLRDDNAGLRLHAVDALENLAMKVCR